MSETKKQDGSDSLDELISTLSDHYGFKKEWCDVMKRWVIRGGEMACEFFWTSDESAEDFMDQLQIYFEDLGSEKSVC